MRCSIGEITSCPETQATRVAAGDAIGFVLRVPIFHIRALAICMSIDDDNQSYDGFYNWFEVKAATGIVDRDWWPAVEFEENS